MSVQKLKKALYSSEDLQKIIGNISKKELLFTKGITYSFKSFLLSYLNEKLKYKVIFLADSVENAEKMRDDIALITENESACELFLPGENYAYCTGDIDDERKGTRLLALDKIHSGKFKILSTTYRNLFEKIPTEDSSKDIRIKLKKSASVKPEQLSEKLVEKGFEKVNSVENIGEFSRRGNIIDIYPYAVEYPVRIELFGDEIESVRFFDPATQKKIKETDSVEIYLSDMKSESGAGVNLFDIIKPENTVFFMEECDDIKTKLEDYYRDHIIAGWERVDHNGLHYEKKYFSPGDVFSLLQSRKGIVNGFLDEKKDIKIAIKDQISYRYDFKPFLTSLKNNEIKGIFSYILCDNPGQTERFNEIILEEIPELKNFSVADGGIHEGFFLPDSDTAVYTDHQIFGRVRRPRLIRRFKKVIPFKDLQRMKYGDFIVHIDHGIGQFLCLEKITVAGTVRDVVKLLYKDGDILFLKLDQIHLIQKYKAGDGAVPALSKLGGKQFQKLKEKTKESVKSAARELIRIYALRKTAHGFAFPSDTVWQTELEASFEYEDTPDQIKSTDDFKRDMESSIPMDRLICGDVGFGKTEVAIRAAFKAAVSGKQVAVLAPTTILVDQHYENFRDRLEKYPVKVDYLSRFKRTSDQKRTLQEIKEGKADIIIGTHRILSKDVEFKDLGLLIVDEEQRFGVSHKERIKELKVNIDVMTLTATPIPRTLHMSLIGVRDLSLINTPPVNRLPIITEIHPFKDSIIYEAVMKEIDRGGQVFFIHNRVETIYSMKSILEKIVPNVSMTVAHGQMKPSELEQVMHEFMYKKYSVLIATTLIENGVDIPNVNTMIVNKADTFGLSQLYQLRGRIGRSSRQAYAYLLTTEPNSLTSVARKRLETISEFTDLGSGFQIAMKDLEIRGAGNMLGSEQSGYIENVGFDLYSKILEEAVLELKEEEFKEILRHIKTPSRYIKATVSLRSKMFLPEYYIEEDAERVEIYRRMMNFTEVAEIDELTSEIKDRFGPMPPEAVNLFNSLYLSIIAGRIFIKSISSVDIGRYEGIKLAFDTAKLNEVENTEIALNVQENLSEQTKKMEFDISVENEGEKVSVVLPYDSNRYEFTEKFVKLLAK
ncbi:MAG TPA: transcription-repair coupling factor [Clostridiales bacterium]|nr:transcription-repair coupling factor [Clostridiales bacterium]HQP70800.1 transcription-repair coupling factor [Clostridiales bacterium]